MQVRLLEAGPLRFLLFGLSQVAWIPLLEDEAGELGLLTFLQLIHVLDLLILADILAAHHEGLVVERVVFASLRCYCFMIEFE